MNRTPIKHLLEPGSNPHRTAFKRPSNIGRTLTER
jgi:hypothetical protein